MATTKTSNHQLKLICGRANSELGKEIGEILGVKPCKVQIHTFPDSEIHVQVEESLRGKDIFIIQSTCPPVNENLMELLIIIDACKRASARQISAVIPYYGYARQDHKSTGREPISAKLVADLIAMAGANRVVSVDLHAVSMQGFFNIPMDHLTAVPTLARYIKSKDIKDAVIVSPDVGRTKVAEKYTDILHLPLAIMTKRREGVGGKQLRYFDIVGDVKGKSAIVIDDIIASGSILQSAEILINAGAKEVYLSITHPILVGHALNLIRSSPIKELIVTDTVPVPREKMIDRKVRVLSIAPLLAKSIWNIYRNKSVSKLLQEEKFKFPV